jgi:hypothetical protein
MTAYFQRERSTTLCNLFTLEGQLLEQRHTSMLLIAISYSCSHRSCPSYQSQKIWKEAFFPLALATALPQDLQLHCQDCGTGVGKEAITPHYHQIVWWTLIPLPLSPRCVEVGQVLQPIQCCLPWGMLEAVGHPQPGSHLRIQGSLHLHSPQRGWILSSPWSSSSSSSSALSVVLVASGLSPLTPPTPHLPWPPRLELLTQWQYATSPSADRSFPFPFPFPFPTSISTPSPSRQCPLPILLTLLLTLVGSSYASASASASASSSSATGEKQCHHILWIARSLDQAAILSGYLERWHQLQSYLGPSLRGTTVNLSHLPRRQRLSWLKTGPPNLHGTVQRSFWAMYIENTQSEKVPRYHNQWQRYYCPTNLSLDNVDIPLAETLLQYLMQLSAWRSKGNVTGSPTQSDAWLQQQLIAYQTASQRTQNRHAQERHSVTGQHTLWQQRMRQMTQIFQSLSFSPTDACYLTIYLREYGLNYASSQDNTNNSTYYDNNSPNHADKTHFFGQVGVPPRGFDSLDHFRQWSRDAAQWIRALDNSYHPPIVDSPNPSLLPDYDQENTESSGENAWEW